MSDIVNAILLGIVEGLTEFLPVSSTAHLLLFQDLLGFQPPGAVFPIVIQFGAILSVVVVYWSKFWKVLIGLPSDASAQHFALGVIIAFLPAAVIGAALHGFIKDVLFAPSIAPYVIATTLILGCSRTAQTDLAGQSVGDIVTNMVQHAKAGDTNYFAPVLDPSSAAQPSQLLAMIQRSGMLTNYSSRLQSESPTFARLNYHYLERGCHFQVDLRRTRMA